MNTKNTLNNELEKLICEFIELIKNMKISRVINMRIW